MDANIVNEFVPQRSHVVVLYFLATGFALGLTVIAFVFSLGARNFAWAKRLLTLGAGIVAIYAGLLLIASARSEEKNLRANDVKYFCEADCHTGYSISDVKVAKSLGSRERAVTAEGTFYVVTVRTWFDGETTSSRRPEGLALTPNPRMVHVVDEQGRRIGTSLEGQKSLEGGSTVPLSHSLRPGESYETLLVFDVPADARNPRLFIEDWLPLDKFLIGHENSFFHKKVYFQLPAAVELKTERNPQITQIPQIERQK